MKCPKCAREIEDDSLFCGYCGAKIEKGSRAVPQPPGEAAPTPGLRGKYQAAPRDAPSPPDGKPQKKKRLGLKILLVCSVLAVLAGGILGWMTARGILDLREYLPMDRFSWTDPSEGVAATDESPGMEADSQEPEKEASSAMSQASSKADAPSESVSATSAESRQQLPAPSDSAGTNKTAAGSDASVH